MKSIEITSSITSLCGWCFSGCSGLTSIKIPSSVTSLGEYCFSDCISNPPFGTPWKEDLKNWDLGDKKEVTDPRFFDGATSFIPDIGDCQMLFLANNVSRMKNTPLGSRIVEVHNGSSLFTGNAGGGESNLRRYIIENDLLEAIIAMPEKDFYVFVS